MHYIHAVVHIQWRIPEICNEYTQSEKRGNNQTEKGSNYLRQKPQFRQGDTATRDATTIWDNPSFPANVAGGEHSLTTHKIAGSNLAGDEHTLTTHKMVGSLPGNAAHCTGAHACTETGPT